MSKKISSLKYSPPDKERYPRPNETGKQGDERSPFEIDRSRIIHSSAFRRLQGKTQVFSPGEGDFFRTRLTHSLEVAQIGKGLALRFGANPELVEAICLAHDLGHPPFGHAGGKALQFKMRNIGGFEANAQNVQLLCFREKRRDDYDGLNLTRATLDGILKYKLPYDVKEDRKRFYYCEGVCNEAVEWAAKYSFPKFDTQSFECQIMDWADEVAYAVHDFEDALHSGFVSDVTFLEPDTFSGLIGPVKEKLVKLGYEPKQDTIGDQWADLRKTTGKLLSMPNPDPRIRRANRKKLTSILISKMIREVSREEVDGATTDRYRYRLKVPLETRATQLLLNNLVDQKVMQSARVQTLEAKGMRLIESLFDVLIDKPEEMFPDDWRLELRECGRDNKAIARLACDYISGMTDSFAEKLYSRLFVPGFGSIHDMF